MIFGKPEIEKVFVPIPSYGIYKDLCAQPAYLKEVVEIAKHPVWITEITEAVKRIRDKADEAETPAELKAYNASVKIVKNLLVLSTAAAAAMDNIATREEINEQKESSI